MAGDADSFLNQGTIPHSNILLAIGPAILFRTMLAHLRVIAQHHHHFVFSSVPDHPIGRV